MSSWRIVAAGGGEAEAQILERRAAPVAVDRVGEGLAVAGRAVEIDGDRAIARRGEHPGVPAIGPAIAERALRAAMDQQQRRQRAGGAGGLDDLAPDGVAMRAGEAEAPHRHRIEVGELVGVDLGQLRRGAAPVEPIEVVGRLQAVQRVDRPRRRGRRRRCRRCRPG